MSAHAKTNSQPRQDGWCASNDTMGARRNKHVSHLQIVCSQPQRDLLASIDVDPQDADWAHANLALGWHLAELADRPAVPIHDAHNARVRCQAMQQL